MCVQLLICRVGRIKTSFTLLRFHMKTEQKLSLFFLHSHCSAVKTELLKTPLKTHEFENGAF